jgi:hypothetical protein
MTNHDNAYLDRMTETLDRVLGVESSIDRPLPEGHGDYKLAVLQIAEDGPICVRRVWDTAKLAELPGLVHVRMISEPGIFAQPSSAH